MRNIPSGSRGPGTVVAFGLLLAVAGCGEPDGERVPEGGGETRGSEVPGARGEGAAEVPEGVDPVLLRPDAEAMSRPAPDSVEVRFTTTEGDFVVRVHREWAPHGADRFYNLVRHGYYDGNRFFRVLDGFVAQWGLHPEPRVSAVWQDATIPPDAVRESNTRGRITFAMGADPGTRTTQVFINYGDNRRLDDMGFAPFGEVVEGLDVVDRLHADYGEGAPRGSGPSQARIAAEGEAYLASEFPDLDRILVAELAEEPGAEAR